MGKKYIVEVNHGERLYRARVGEDGVPSLSYIGSTESLTPYTAPDLEKVNREKDALYDEARDRGYAEGRARGYQEGLFDEWEAARKIICEMDCEDHMKIFGGDNLDYIFALSPTTVIEKLKAYEQEQNKIIKVGDIVRMKGAPEIEIWVTDVSDEDGGRLSGLALKTVGDNCEIGDTYAYREIQKFERTGRHYDVATVLEKMRGEQNG